jgi:two-component system sensor histidine kinase YesM
MKSLREIGRKVIHLNFRTKILLSSVLTAVIIGGAALFGLGYSNSNYNRELYIHTADSLSYFSDAVTSQLSEVASLSRLLSTNKSLQNELISYNSADEAIERNTNSNNITSIFSRSITDSVAEFTIYPASGSAITFGRDSSAEKADVVEALKNAADSENGGEVWAASGRGDGSLLCMRRIRKVEGLSLDTLGYICVRVDLPYMVSQARTNRDNAREANYSILIYCGGKKYYSLSSNYSASAPDVVISSAELKNDSFFISERNGSKWFAVSRALPIESRQSWRTVFLVNYNDVFHTVIVTNAVCIAAVLFAVLLAFAASGVFVHGLSRRFDRLVTKMTRLKNGNFELMPRAKSYGNDELDMLDQYFDQMTVDFKKMIDDNYVKQLLLTQTQIKILENQINPHFLYNTLESIRWFARRCGEEHITVIAESLGTLLRSSLSDLEDTVTLDNEIKVVKSYLKIQKIRFSDMLDAQFDIDPAVLTARVPKMSIQPLVENAILHTRSDTIDPCNILIRAAAKDGRAVISVTNNGPPIDTDILRKLKTREVSPSGNGIGLNNIDSRLRMLLGDDCGLRFANDGENVTVSFSVPLHEEND